MTSGKKHQQAACVAAFKAAATPDPDGQHLLIDAQILNELLARYADILDTSRVCCGG